MARNYGERTLVWVTVPGADYTDLKYGFRSGLRDSLRNNLGQVAVTASDLQNLVIGANFPKPSRATKRFATGNESSYVSVASIPAAKNDGWKVQRPRANAPSDSNLSDTVYVTINGIKYAWNMPLNTVAGEANHTDGGVTAASASESGLVFGAEFPKPPRITKQHSTGTLSVFCDPSRLDNIPEGWAKTGRGNYTASDLSTYL